MEPRPPLRPPHRQYGRGTREILVSDRTAKRAIDRVAGIFFDLEDLFVANRVETKSAIVAAIVNRRNH